MAKNEPVNQDYDTSQIDTANIAQTVEANRIVAYNHRRLHERRWYDNNFFDDGFHFRYLSRTTNKIVDLSERATIYTPQRAIPKASRQIRGIANLLLSSDPTPTVFPEETPSSGDPKKDELIKKAAKEQAQRKGYWLEEEWDEPDASGETLLQKLALMPILTAKHSISYMQIWADPQYEKIRTQVYDAFDLYVIGSYNNLEDLPFIIKATPLLVSQIRANPNFNDEKNKVQPDNKPAESEIKQAYMRSRYGRDASSDQAGTAILYEAFMKEYLNTDNIARIRKQKDGDIILKDRKVGDCIIRQVFTASGKCLRDTYLNMEEYPFVDFRFEPGPLYSVPFIERFINANKSLDSAVSRMERYFHTMVTGIWVKQRGEQFKINNIAGGQVVEYQNRPPEQANLASPGQWTFEFINLLQSFIEEQGVTTTTLGKLPSGVHAAKAIESLKESEYANLVISTRRLSETVRRIAQRMFQIADDHFISPKTISHTDAGETSYFKVIGRNALNRRKNNKIETPEDLISLSGKEKLDIEITQGMAFTKEGQKQSMQDLINTMLQWAQLGFVNPEAVKVVIKKYLEVYQFGSTAEFMEAFDAAATTQQMTQEQQAGMKMALLQALQDAGEVGQEASERRITENKLGALSALKDSGLADHIQAAGAGPVKESVSINYKDAPEDIKRQMEQEAGFNPSNTLSPAASDQIAKHRQLQHQTAQQGIDQSIEQTKLDLQQQAQEAQQQAAQQPQGGQGGTQ